MFIQTKTAPDLLGRVNSIISLPRATLAPVSLAVTGLLVAVDVRLGFALAGLPLLMLGIGLACSRQARGLRIERRPEEPAAPTLLT